MNAASWESSSEGLDFSREEDYFLVEITNDSRIMPAKPSDTCGSTKQINFSQFAPLPFYNINDNARWKLIETALNNIIIARNLAAADVINHICSYSRNDLKFTALKFVLEEGILDGDTYIPLLESVIPKMAHLALSMKSLILKPIRLLRASRNASVTMSQHQAAAILANAFFCTFPEELRNDAFSDGFNVINFSGRPENVEKIKFLLYYFYRVTSKMPNGTISIVRTCLPEAPRWAELKLPIAGLQVFENGVIEDNLNAIHMDFANKYIGGGVLGQGAVQEEIRFLCCPEMIISCLLCEKMTFAESIRILGAETYSNYAGYSKSLTWKPKNRPVAQVPRDEFGRFRSELIAIDALFYKFYSAQFNIKFIKRELNKAYSGFSVKVKGSENRPIATGNWGCGVFNGDLQLKSMIQLLAASVAKRELLYHTFGDKRFSDELQTMITVLHNSKICTAQLYQLISQYSFFASHKSEKLFDFLKKKLLSRLPESEEPESSESSCDFFTAIGAAKISSEIPRIAIPHPVINKTQFTIEPTSSESSDVDAHQRELIINEVQISANKTIKRGEYQIRSQHLRKKKTKMENKNQGAELKEISADIVQPRQEQQNKVEINEGICSNITTKESEAGSITKFGIDNSRQDSVEIKLDRKEVPLATSMQKVQLKIPDIF